MGLFIIRTTRSRIKGVLPTPRKLRALGKLLCGRMVFEVFVHDRVTLSQIPLWTGALDQYAHATWLEPAMFEDPKIEAGEAGLFRLFLQIFHMPAARQFPAGLARLRNFHDGFVKFETIANAKLRFRGASQSDVFSKAAERDVCQPWLQAPIIVMRGGIGAQRLVGATVILPVRLFITLNTAIGEPDGTGGGFLENAAFPRLIPPLVRALRCDGFGSAGKES